MATTKHDNISSHRKNISYPKVEIKDEEVMTFIDSSSNKIETVEHDGFYFPRTIVEMGAMPDPRSNIPSIVDMSLRPDDILILAYPKAGTHWTSEIVNMLVSGKTEYNKNSKMRSMLPFHTPEIIDELPSPRVINSHSYFRHLPKDIIKKNIKIVFINRNPKDIFVSFHHHIQHRINYKGSLSDHLDLFMADEAYFCSWHKYILDWEKTIKQHPELNILFITYEDLQKNQIREIERIADFLQVKSNMDFYNKVAEKCSFDQLKEAYQNKDYSLGGFIFRKGGVGDWKNKFTVTDNEKFDQYLKKTMSNSEWKFIYSLS